MPKQGIGIKVDVRDNNLEKALKKFKKKVKKSNLMLQIFDGEFYKKPSALRRERKMKAVARNKYKVLEMKRIDNI